MESEVQKLCKDVRKARNDLFEASGALLDLKDGTQVLTAEEISELKQEAEDAKQAACDYLDWVCSLTPPVGG